MWCGQHVSLLQLIQSIIKYTPIYIAYIAYIAPCRIHIASYSSSTFESCHFLIRLRVSYLLLRRKYES